jgi:16S rRNA processing protein RimM
MSAPLEPKYVTVARVLGARGNKGEIAAELLTDFPERLPQIKQISLLNEAGVRSSVELHSFWVDRNHPGNGVFHFAGVNSIGEAEKLRGLLVQIPFEQRARLPAGSYFVTDLIGCAVFEFPPIAVPQDLKVAPRALAQQVAYASSPCFQAEVPRLLGKVREVYFPGESQPGTPLLAVDTANGELLVPLAEDICFWVDVTARRIEVRLPEGLRDLNR